MNIKIKPQIRQADLINIHISVVDNKAYANVILKSDCIMESKTVVIEGPEYDNWGTDDNYIYNLILQKLGYERA